MSELISRVGAGSDHRVDRDGGSDGTDVVFVVAFVILLLVFSLVGAGLFVGAASGAGSVGGVSDPLLLGVVAAVTVLVVFSACGRQRLVRVGARAVFAFPFPVASAFVPWPIVGGLLGAGAAVGLVVSDDVAVRFLAGVVLVVVFGSLLLL